MSEAIADGAPDAARVDLGGLSPGDLARLAEILAVLARHGVVVVAGHGTTIAVRPRTGGGAAAVALRRSFADLGPTFEKLRQLAASSPGLFAARLLAKCRRLLDRVPPVPVAHVRATIARELGAPEEARQAAPHLAIGSALGLWKMNDGP